MGEITTDDHLFEMSTDPEPLLAFAPLPIHVFSLMLLNDDCLLKVHGIDLFFRLKPCISSLTDGRKRWTSNRGLHLIFQRDLTLLMRSKINDHS